MLVEYTSVDLQRNEHTVLSNVSFKVNKGEFIYLLGKVGSGKSTLLKSIYAEVPVKYGNATVLDYNLSSIKKRDIPFLRRNIGFIFQDFQLLMDRSIFDNLDFVLRATGHKDKNTRFERIEEVLNAVNMNEKSYKMPYHLSGGEQQRVVIARALLNNPRLILADEPTGNLDKDTGAQILQLIYDISKGGTSVIMATHNTSWIDEFPGREMFCENKHLKV